MKPDSSAGLFEALVSPHVGALYQTAYKLCGSQADAEDIVQDTLVKLFPKTGELQAIRELRPWLVTVVYHQFVDHCRKQRRSPVSNGNRLDCGDEDPLARLDTPDPGPDQLLESARQSDRVLAVLNSLDRDARALVVLHLMEGFTLDELTSVFNVPLGTLKSRLHRVKAYLKKRLSVEPFGGGERETMGSS